MKLSSKAHWIENKLINWMVFLVWYGNLMNGKNGLEVNAKEGMVMVLYLKWMYGYGLVS